MSIPIRDCIRCDFCASVCPEQLQPQQLYAFSRHQLHEQTRQFDMLQCSECGACESVCPSHLPLTDIFHNEKLMLCEQTQADAEAARWQQRFEQHQARCHQDSLTQQERKLKKLQAKSKDLAAGKTISKTPPRSEIGETSMGVKSPTQIQAEITAAVARTRARKAALQRDAKANEPAPDQESQEQRSQKQEPRENDA